MYHLLQQSLSRPTVRRWAIALIIPITIAATVPKAQGSEQDIVPADVIADVIDSDVIDGDVDVIDVPGETPRGIGEVVEAPEKGAIADIASEDSNQNGTSRILQVNPNGGETFGTLTEALAIAQSGDTIQLAAGTYSAETGEQFPLIIPKGVTIVGNENTEGKGVEIIGGGAFISRTFARQNVALVVTQDNIKIGGISVSNPNIRGTGLWIESGNPVVQFSRFHQSHRDGIFVTGTARPLIKNSLFHKNGGNGISVARNGGGEIRDSWFQDTGFGLAIGGNANPKVINNNIVNNNDGLVVSGSARPMLRGNVIRKNLRSGMVAISNAAPDLGTAADPGQNQWIDNGQYHFQNATRAAILAVGNQFNGGANMGSVITQ
ncbi:MAG: DUF1565 domain-containing protein [Cyanobacteria bacterium P01_C01_bin.89]